MHDGVEAEHPTGLCPGTRFDREQSIFFDGEAGAAHGGVVFVQVVVATLGMRDLGVMEVRVVEVGMRELRVMEVRMMEVGMMEGRMREKVALGCMSK